MWLACDALAPVVNAPSGAVAVAIALPARDEADRIAGCLAALDIAAARVAGPVTIVVMANNCRDATAAVARCFRARTARIVVEEVVLPPARAHAGGARGAAMDDAADLAGPRGVVMTTDADSCVDPGWIAANLGELAAGADAVAGIIAFDAATRAALPALAGRNDEWRLAALHAELEHRLDPVAHDPWPRHLWAWGASLALTVAAYRTIGGVPCVALAEDRGIAAAIERADLRLRRSYAPIVFTSARRDGRAPGGFADLLTRYATDPSAPCDAALEPTCDFVGRLIRRARLRAAVPTGFGERWTAIDATLPRKRVRPVDLPAEIALAERLIAALRRRGERRADNPAVALAA